eukprot:scaffold201311_cov36-Cyclotella_meneghiniana.AAC.1
MEPYLRKALRQFDNIVPTKRRDSPYPHIEPKYGAKEQFAEYDTSPEVGKQEQKHVQKVNGKFLWYARAVDPTVLVPLNVPLPPNNGAVQNVAEIIKAVMSSAAEAETGGVIY